MLNQVTIASVFSTTLRGNPEPQGSDPSTAPSAVPVTALEAQLAPAHHLR